MGDQRLFVASADGHVGIRTPEYSGYLDPEYRERFGDFVSAAPDRFYGVIAIPTLADVDAAVAEVRRAHADGLTQGVLLPLEYNQPLVHHPRYEPFWDVCDELDLSVAVHLGDGEPTW